MTQEAEKLSDNELEQEKNEENTPKASKVEETPSLEEQLAEMKDKWVRSIAESENIKKRSKKEVEDTLKYATTSFARDMIVIADYVEQALSTMQQENVDNEKMKAFISGIEMTIIEIHNVFERQGIKKIDISDKQFDPNLHQAMMEVESENHEAGQIVQQMQADYKIHDRLLRPSMVSVCKKSAE